MNVAELSAGLEMRKARVEGSEATRNITVRQYEEFMDVVKSCNKDEIEAWK